MPANYNKIAKVYDFLSRIIFGRQIVLAQTCLISSIPRGSRILIVGGGTGWILEKITEEYPSGLTIDYVEASSVMIELSQKRNCKNNTVNFITMPVEDYCTAYLYDVIFTPFILDNFSQSKVGMVFNNLNAMLTPHGLWLYADFVYDHQKSPFWQKILLRLMYLFFSLSTCIETQELIPMDQHFNKMFNTEFEKFHYFKFIRSAVYQKL